MDSQELITQSEGVTILLPPQPQPDDMHTAFIISCGLKSLGKTVSFERQVVKEHISISPSVSAKEKTFIVSLKGLAPWISRVRYEKERNDLKLYFTLQQGELSSNNLSLEVQNHSNPAIIVGNKPTQDNVRDQEDNTLQGHQVKETILSLLSSHKNRELVLLATLLSKIAYQPKKQVYFAHLAKEDFLRSSKTTPKTLAGILPSLQDTAKLQQACFILFFSQLHSSSLQAVLWDPDKNILPFIPYKEAVQQKEGWSLFPLNPEQVKASIQSLKEL